MSENKQTIGQYFQGFIEGDHEMVLSCTTDTIFWEIVGIFQLTGKEAFNKEIENYYFEGSPAIKVIHMVEENNIVVAEGFVQGQMKDGQLIDAVFCDVFHMDKGKISYLTTYLINK